VLLSATRKNYTQVLGVVQIGDLVFPGDRAHLISARLFRIYISLINQWQLSVRGYADHGYLPLHAAHDHSTSPIQ
ncbi:hypothetical protein, partial [Arthrobacter sp. NIO-1057]|uniref:hypothetical protein n=1 Tax=Arthrobacter sp. NIO-1057 TaxID=993071 RepID=UPI001C40047F